MIGFVGLATSPALAGAIKTRQQNVKEQPPRSPSAAGACWQRFARQGYGFKLATAATLIAGIYLHVTSLFIGRQLFQHYILTPKFDMLLAVPMTYAGICGWIIWRRVMHPAQWHKLVYALLVLYFTISIPIHVQTFLTQSTDYIHAFPEWYSYFILPVMVALLVFALRIEFAKPPPAQTGG